MAISVTFTDHRPDPGSDGDSEISDWYKYRYGSFFPCGRKKSLYLSNAIVRFSGTGRFVVPFMKNRSPVV